MKLSRWLLGEDDGSEPTNWWLASRTFDIDVARDVYRKLKFRFDWEVQQAEAPITFAPHVDVEERKLTLAQQATRVQNVKGRPPTIVLVPEDPFAGIRWEEIDIRRLETLGKFERGRLMIHGAGVSASFQKGVASRVSGSAEDIPHVQEIVELLQRSGRRRLNWIHVFAFWPLAVAVVLVIVAAWAILSSPASLQVIVLAIALILLVGVAGVVGTIFAVRRAVPLIPGHRFRESTRAEVRARIANSWATFRVSLITVPIGALLGWLLGLLFGPH